MVQAIISLETMHLTTLIWFIATYSQGKRGSQSKGLVSVVKSFETLIYNNSNKIVRITYSSNKLDHKDKVQ